MSNEVNIVETFYGTTDPGVSLKFYDWSGGQAVRGKPCIARANKYQIVQRLNGGWYWPTTGDWLRLAASNRK